MKPTIATATALTAALTIGVAGCGDEETATTGPEPGAEPSTGALSVTAPTEGATLDEDGYEVTVAGETATLGDTGSTLFTGLSEGTTSVELGDLQRNCSAGGSSASVDVVAGDTVSHAFSVTCDRALFGHYLFVTREGSGNVEIWRDEGGQPAAWHSLPASATGTFGVTIAPDGTEFAYTASFSSGPDTMYVRGVGTADSTGGRVAARAGYHWADWGSDADSLVVMTASRFSDSARLALVDRELSGARYLTDTTRADIDPSWKPGGRSVVFARRGPESDDLDLHVVDLDGGSVSRLTSTADVHEMYPDVSPSGDRIAYLTAPDSLPLGGGRSLLVAGSDGGSPQTVHEAAEMHDPEWGPAGEWIYFTEYDPSADATHVHRVRPSDSSVEQLTSSRNRNVLPTPEPLREP